MRTIASRLSTARMRWYSPTVSCSICGPESGTNTTIISINPDCLRGGAALFIYNRTQLLCARFRFGIRRHPEVLCVHVNTGVT